MSEDIAEVDNPNIDDNEMRSDPFLEVIEEQARAHAQEIETMQENEEGSPEENSTETSQQTTSDTSSETVESDTSNEATETGNGKRPGFDVVLREVEEKLGKDYADVFRSVQTSHNTIREEWRDAQESMRLELDLLKEKREGDQGEPRVQEQVVVDPDLAKITPKQWELFDKMAQTRGYVQQGQLDNQQSVDRVNDYLQQSIVEGLDRFGESFGAREEDGQFVFGDNVKESCEQVYERLFDGESRGPTPQDLYILANFDSLIEGAKAQGVAAAKDGTSEQQAKNQKRTERVSRAQTENRTTSTTAEPVVRRTGDSLEDTIARASADSWRNIPNAI